MRCEHLQEQWKGVHDTFAIQGRKVFERTNHQALHWRITRQDRNDAADLGPIAVQQPARDKNWDLNHLV